MQTPKRKPGKYANFKPDNNITMAKFNELKNKLEKLKKVSFPRSRSEVMRLAEMGDFSENHAYQMAKGRLRGINQGIIDIEKRLKFATIIKPSKNTETVQLGSKVTIEIRGKQKTYEILGPSETNPLKNIISHKSPIGSALMECKTGDKIKIKLKNKEVEYKIIKIN